jgi:hypothetical protein
MTLLPSRTFREWVFFNPLSAAIVFTTMFLLVLLAIKLYIAYPDMALHADLSRLCFGGSCK